MAASRAVIQALAVTAELTGSQLSEAAARVMVADLSPYPERQVLGALSRCRKELRGRLTVSDVIARLDDGRPGPEEAWALMPLNERATVVWTEEMAGAWGVALPLLEEGDRIAARMAFLESYRARVQKARDAGSPVRWTVSLGHDPHERAAVIAEAARLGRISEDRAQQLGYTVETNLSPEVAAFAADTIKRLTSKGPG
ncbi:MAG TPA: hypothetical protein VLH12_08370 [Usitatibacter sp.]|nr:hypothetical protein [Usitatibacter sp.]